MSGQTLHSIQQIAVVSCAMLCIDERTIAVDLKSPGDPCCRLIIFQIQSNRCLRNNQPSRIKGAEYEWELTGTVKIRQIEKGPRMDGRISGNTSGKKTFNDSAGS